MLDMRTLLRGAVAAAGVLMIAFAASALAADILDDWDTVKPPPRPELKPVMLERSTTALLILDHDEGELRRPATVRGLDSQCQATARRGALGRSHGVVQPRW